MSELPYHGWTHRPKALGGTDPIPAVEVAAAYTEWAALSSTTNWVAPADTDLNFSIYSGSYDTGVPTFAVNVDGNLEIGKEGVYLLVISVIGLSWSSGVAAEARIGIARIAGEQPSASVHSNWTMSAFYDVKQPYLIPSSIDIQPEPLVHYQNVIAYDAGQFTGGGTAGPTEFQVHAVNYQDGVETNDSTVVVRMYAVRLGDAYP